MKPSMAAKLGDLLPLLGVLREVFPRGYPRAFRSTFRQHCCQADSFQNGSNLTQIRESL